MMFSERSEIEDTVPGTVPIRSTTACVSYGMYQVWYQGTVAKMDMNMVCTCIFNIYIGIYYNMKEYQKFK